MWRLLWETDLMETLAARAWQPVGGGLFIEEGGEELVAARSKGPQAWPLLHHTPDRSTQAA